MSDIFQASKFGYISVIEDYIRSGGDLNVVDGRYPSWPPLFYAAWYGQSQAASLLISAGANIHRKDPYYGRTPAHMAAWGG